jgi:hypothetical protein
MAYQSSLVLLAARVSCMPTMTFRLRLQATAQRYLFALPQSPKPSNLDQRIVGAATSRQPMGHLVDEEQVSRRVGPEQMYEAGSALEVVLTLPSNQICSITFA